MPVPPSTPSTPSTPTTTGTPSAPSAPDTPSTPNTPDTPSTPNTLSTPNTSSAPNTPDTPITPDTPTPTGTPTKSELRAALRAVRRAIASDPADRTARSARIWARIVPLLDLGALGPGSGIERARIMLFDSLPTEPDTSGWIEWCRSHGHEVFLPAVDGDELRVEPGDVDPATLDVVIIPGLGFATDGRRLGQGGGHYDRLMARLRPEALTIGVCFAEQLVAELPTEPHDRPVSHVVADRR